MKNKKLFAALLSIAAINPEGFTISANTLQPMKKGFAVAMSETQNSFGNAGLLRVINFVNNSKTANAFGGWLDSKTGLFYFDAVTIVTDLDTAKRLGRANGQIAIFDLENLKEIRL